jgi:hypothetical protein
VVAVVTGVAAGRAVVGGEVVGRGDVPTDGAVAAGDVARVVGVDRGGAVVVVTTTAGPSALISSATRPWSRVRLEVNRAATTTRMATV